MNARTIAVIKPCCIGDCVMALPALAVLRAAHAHATMDVFVGTHSSRVFDGQPSIDNLRHTRDQPNPASSARLALSLRRYDAVVILDRSRYLKAAMRMSRVRVGAAVTQQRPETRHESRVYLDVLGDIGVAVPSHVPLPKLDPAPGASDRATRLIGVDQAPYVVIHPGGASNPGTNMFEKRWPADRYRELARELVGLGLRVVLTGGTGDSEAADIVREGVEGMTSLVGQADLQTTAEVIRRASLYVGGDTGMSHIAGAVETPVVAIFGPTNPRRYRPLGERVIILAPEASWDVEDRDLRARDNACTLPSTSDVEISDVLSACKHLLDNRETL